MNKFEIYWTVSLSIFLAIVAVAIYLSRNRDTIERILIPLFVSLIPFVFVFGALAFGLTVDTTNVLPLKKVGKINDVTVGHLNMDTWATTDNREIYATPDKLICMKEIVEINMYNNVARKLHELVKCNP